MERILAVYDVEPQYAARFAEVTNQKDMIPFTVMAFTSFEKLKDYTIQHQVDILLVGAGTAKEMVELLPVDKIMILNEGEAVTVKDEYPGIYKYQSSDAILRDVMACYGEEEKKDDSFCRAQKAQIIGVYSPISRCLKTSFALTLGQLLALENHVLYVNLELFSGFSALMGEKYSGDLADVLYFYRQGNVGMIKLKSVVYQLGQMDYIPPVRYPNDLNQVGAKEMAEVLLKIAEQGGYETLVVDVGNYGREAEVILENCNVIYMPVREDGISISKIEEWENYLSVSEHQTILEKTVRLKLPFHSSFGRKENYVEQLLWGELGDYVRQLIKGRGGNMS